MAPKPKLNPYETLGVPKDADDAAIKRAYRNQSKKTHPDAGGTSDAFAQTQLAYSVLSDHDKRAHYDATGTIDSDNVQNPFAAAIGIVIAGLLNACAQVEATRGNMEAAPLFDHVRKGIKAQLGEFNSKREALEQVIANMRKVAKRIKKKSKDSKPNFLQRAMEEQANNRAEQLETIQTLIDNHTAALVLLDDYDFDQLMERADNDMVTLAKLAYGTFGAGNFRPF